MKIVSVKAFFRLFFCAALFCFLTGCGKCARKRTVDQGLKALEEGNYARAVLLLTELAKQYPENPTVICNLGIACWKGGDSPTAEQYLKTAVKLAPLDYRPHEFLGLVLADRGKTDEAIKALSNAEAINRLLPRIPCAIAAIEIREGRQREAFGRLMKVLDQHGDYPPALYNLAVLYRDELKNKEYAARFFTRFINAAPDDPRAAIAHEFLQPPVSTKNVSAELVEKARAAMKRKANYAAREFLKQALSEDPKNVDALWEMAVLHDKIDADSDTVLTWYEQFLKLNPNDPRAAEALRRVETLKRPPQETVDLPDNATAEQLCKEGYRRYEKEDIKGAIEYYRRALAKDGKHLKSLYNLGVAYRAEKNLAMARDVLTRACITAPDFAEAGVVLAKVNMELRDNTGAIEQLNRVLRLRPDYADAHRLLGEVYRLENKPEYAEMHFKLYTELTKEGAASGGR